MQPLNALIVEDSEDDLALVLATLKRDGFAVSHRTVMSGAELSSQLASGPWDIVISDYSLPTFSGPEALKLVREKDGEVPFILISGKVSDEIAVNMIKAGANDYVLKDNLIRLGPAVRRELAEVKRMRAIKEELRIKEEMVRRSQKMEAVGSLAGGIVHDFNNFLAFVMIATELAETELGEHASAGKVREIRMASERAAGLTRQLLTFCRRQKIEPQNVDLNQTVTECHGMLARLLPEEIQINLKLEAKDPQIFIDPSQLEQVLMNLIVNARDAMPSGGNVTIRTFTQAQGVALSVSDEGVGMDQATKEKIFEPFFTTKGPDRGTGLGLSTVMSIVSDCRGGMEVESAPGKGATFTVLFPAVAAAGKTSASAGPRQLSLQGSETVLLLEDDRSVREMMVEVLKRHGYDVIVASSPDHATNIAKSHPGEIHILLSDVAMPQANGVEFGYLFTQMRQNARVLFVTGYYDKEKFEIGDPELFKNVLQKPFSGMALLEKMRAALV